MFLANGAIRRPVAMCCLIIALSMLGFNAYRKLGLELMPRMEIPYITVVTVYPGASPADIEVDVAKRIEDAVSSVDGLKHVTSACMENVVQTVLEFHLGVDVNVVATDVREKIDLELANFPIGVEKPVVMKFDINEEPIATLALTGDLTIDELYDYADNTLRDRISVLTGVANVELIGGSEREVHVLLDRTTLSAAGLSTAQVSRALQSGINTTPAGRVTDQKTEYSVRFDAEYDSVDEIGSLQVAGADGARRYLRDLGTVVLASEERREAAFVDGRPCIAIRVVKKSDANTVAVVGHVRDAMDTLRTQLPGGMALEWVSDNGAFIQATLDSTVWNVVIGILLTSAVLFLFLFNVRTTFVVAVSMPLTIVISLFFIQILGFTLNMSTLLAIGLSIGVLVTNSIVVMESIISWMPRSPNSWSAARQGAADVGEAVLASAGTNIVVLFPIGLMGSVVGLFFRPFAITALIVNVVSLFISFTLTPILCALLLKHSGQKSTVLGRFESGVDKLINASAAALARMLCPLAGKRWAAIPVLLASAALFVGSFAIVPLLGFSFVPDMDEGDIYVKLEYPTRLNLSETVARAQKVEKQLSSLPNLQRTVTLVGTAGGGIGQSTDGVYLAQLLLKFSKKTERRETIHDLAKTVRDRLKNYPDCIVTVSVGGGVGGQDSPVQMEIAGDSIKELERIALALRQRVVQIPGFVDPDTSVRDGKPELLVEPIRPILADIGSTPADLAAVLRGNLEGLESAIYRSGDRTYDIRVKLAETPGVDQVPAFQVPVGGDRTAVLSGFADIKETLASVQITRSDKRRVTHLYSNLSPSLPLGTAIDTLEKMVNGSAILPPGYRCEFRGEYERMAESVAEFLEAGILAALLTYLMLAAVLESFTRPFLIMTTLPMGLVGVLGFLFIAGKSIDIFVLLGCVMLIGIVVNNAVLILSHMHALIQKGANRHQAILEALKGEFRPVLMVTLAAVLGMMPLAVAAGLGSELSNGIGIASIGGIAVSAAMTLILLPALILTGRNR
ncbi:MAG: multidrug transporter AcrB [Candidatus Hydrogenedentota bacterium]